MSMSEPGEHLASKECLESKEDSKECLRSNECLLSSLVQSDRLIPSYITQQASKAEEL